MADRVFECTACGYLMIMNEKIGTKCYCSLCRSRIVPINEEYDLTEWNHHKCDECGLEFYTLKRKLQPYKCPYCNYTFKISPYRKSEERL